MALGAVVDVNIVRGVLMGHLIPMDGGVNKGGVEGREAMFNECQGSELLLLLIFLLPLSLLLDRRTREGSVRVLHKSSCQVHGIDYVSR